jgi:hypothetical protein
MDQKSLEETGHELVILPKVSWTMSNKYSRTTSVLTMKLRRGTGDDASKDRGLDSGGTNFPHAVLIYKHVTIVEHRRTLWNE